MARAGETFWRALAVIYRQTVPYCGTSRRWLDDHADDCEHHADCLALDGLDLSLASLFAPTPGDALALTEVTP